MILWLTLGAVALVVTIGGVAAYARRNVRYTTCPRTGNRVRLSVVEDPVTGWYSDVSSCSAFEAGTGVSCGKSCVNECHKR